jgi:hypothetical protein
MQLMQRMTKCRAIAESRIGGDGRDLDLRSADLLQQRERLPPLLFEPDARRGAPRPPATRGTCWSS